jgi:hypothetical protein
MPTTESPLLAGWAPEAAYALTFSVAGTMPYGLYVPDVQA